MYSGLRICIEKGGPECLRPSVGRPKLTIVSEYRPKGTVTKNVWATILVGNGYCPIVITGALSSSSLGHSWASL